jgi:hypothetical protein
MFQDKKSQRRITISHAIGIVQIINGGFLLFVFGLTFISCTIDIILPNSTTETDVYIVIAVIAGLSAILFVNGLNRSKLVKLTKQYMFFLSQGPSHSIDHLAAIIKSPVHIVRNNLTRMIKKGFLFSAYIDNNTNHINCSAYMQRPQPIQMTVPNQVPPMQMSVPKQVQPMQMTVPSQVQPVQPIINVEYVSVVCKNCGASNKIKKGASADCEYCGSNVS